MTLEEAFNAQLRSYEPLTFVVDQRVYGPVSDQGTAFPRVLVQRRAGVDAFQSHSGRSGTERSIWQISVDAERHCDAVTAMTHVINCLDAFAGVLGGPGGVRVGRLTRYGNGRVDHGRDPVSKIWRQTCDFYCLSAEEL